MNETHHTSVAKMLAVLEELSRCDHGQGTGLTVAALARAVGRDKSSMSRQLRPMVELGLVERNEDGLHTLGWKLFAVAARAGDQRLLLLAPPVMRQLAQGLRERVHLSVRREAEVLTILSEGSQRSVEAVGWVGRTVPVSCTSSGRALLFDHDPDEIRALLVNGFTTGAGTNAPTTATEVIDRVASARKQGYAPVVDEFDDDLSGVAAPIRDMRGRIVAALNVSAPSYRLRGKLDLTGGQVSKAAAYLSRALSSPSKSA